MTALAEIQPLSSSDGRCKAHHHIHVLMNDISRSAEGKYDIELFSKLQSQFYAALRGKVALPNYIHTENIYSEAGWSLICLDSHYANRDRLANLLSQATESSSIKENTGKPQVRIDYDLLADFLTKAAQNVKEYQARFLALINSMSVPQLPVPKELLRSLYAEINYANSFGIAYEKFKQDREIQEQWKLAMPFRIRRSKESNTLQFDGKAVNAKALEAYWDNVPELAFNQQGRLTQDTCIAVGRALAMGAYLGIQAEPFHFTQWNISENHFHKWSAMLVALSLYVEVFGEPYQGAVPDPFNTDWTRQGACPAAFYYAMKVFPEIKGLPSMASRGVIITYAGYTETAIVQQNYSPFWKVQIQFQRNRYESGFLRPKILRLRSK